MPGQLLLDGSLVRCYACGAAAALTGPEADPLEDRAFWPEVPCVTPGCAGRLVPEALN